LNPIQAATTRDNLLTYVKSTALIFILSKAGWSWGCVSAIVSITLPHHINVEILRNWASIPDKPRVVST
jgi:hypothetical protein